MDDFTMRMVGGVVDVHFDALRDRFAAKLDGSQCGQRACRHAFAQVPETRAKWAIPRSARRCQAGH